MDTLGHFPPFQPSIVTFQRHSSLPAQFSHFGLCTPACRIHQESQVKVQRCAQARQNILLGSPQPGKKLGSENQPQPWTITKHQLDVQGRENRRISPMLSSLKQESTFSWDTANQYVKGMSIEFQPPKLTSRSCLSGERVHNFGQIFSSQLIEAKPVFSAEVTTWFTDWWMVEWRNLRMGWGRVRCCTFNAGSVHLIGDQRAQEQAFIAGGDLSRRAWLCEWPNNERNTSGSPPQWESAFLFLSTLQKQVVPFAFRGHVWFFLARPKKENRRSRHLT